MAANYTSSNCLPKTEIQNPSDEYTNKLHNSLIKSSPKSCEGDTLPVNSPCFNKDCCPTYCEERESFQGTETSSFLNDKSNKEIVYFVPNTRDMSVIRQRRRPPPSSPSDSDDSNSIKYDYSERVHSRRKKTTLIPERSQKSTVITDDNSRAICRLRRIHRSSVSPVRDAGRHRSRTSKHDHHSRTNKLELVLRRRPRPRTPPTPDKRNKSKEKVPYFTDVARERDRLRKKYKSPSPVVTSSRQHSASTSRTPRRCESRSRPRTHTRSRSRSRSKSHHRRSESDRHRRSKRDESPYKTWPAAAPQIITIPVPVPDYSFAFPPSFHSPPGWPQLPMRPARYPYFPHHRELNNRRIPFETSMPSVRYMPPPPYGFSGMSHSSRPLRRDVYRYPYT